MKLEGWESRLFKKLDTTQPFKWGENDCCLFAADCLIEIYGIDFAEEFRGYKTAAGAYKRLAKAGGLYAVLDSKFGPAINPKLAKRGAVVSFYVGKELALGVHIGDKIAAVSEKGLIFLPMEVVDKAWQKS